MAQSTPSADTHNPHGSLDMACEKCHTFAGWSRLKATPEFDHKKTRFPLQGLHAKLVACQECHANLVFSNVPNRCADCHADIHRRKNTALCEACHSEAGWQVLLPAINRHLDRFPLIGAHATVDCASCHKAGALAKTNRLGLSTECVTCHLNAYQKTTNPNHRAMGFSINCIECHTTMDSWNGAVVVPGLTNAFGRQGVPRRSAK
jgi:hypothetical protein